MGYNALSRMKDKNRIDYEIEDCPHIPGAPASARNFGREALAFVRDDCEDLRFDCTDERRRALEDTDGRSASPGTIPYNMERDLDRLSFEAAIGRFLESGSREDAFDIYYCYCEIFKPFGTGYDTTGLLLKMLSEHETNASSLLMKHRDHYSHSVYVFLIGLALYRNNAALRTAYNEKYGLENDPRAACHFLEFWGLTSLFHDIGYPFDFDIEFADSGMKWTYFFDSALGARVTQAKAYRAVVADDYTKKSGAIRVGRSKFVDDINEIVSLSDVAPSFEPDMTKLETSGLIAAVLEEKQRKTGLYLSDSNYLNLYDFALALNGRYCGASTEDEMKRAFEEGLSLEYQLSNIAQAKGFATQLEGIGCFYTDRPVEYEQLFAFSDDELDTLAKSEHDRWCTEKLALGWRFGDNHVNRLENRSDNVMRERTRLHDDLVPFGDLPHAEALKDSDPMLKMLELIREFEGLTIYRM